MYDVLIIGAGPGGIFSAYELMERKPDLKIAVFEVGHPLEHRKCPIDGDKIKSCIENHLFFLYERIEELWCHGRLDSNSPDILLGDLDVSDDLVCAVRCTKIKPDLSQARFSQSLQGLFRGQEPVGVEVLIHFCFFESSDDGVVFFNLHERLQIHIRYACRLSVNR